MTTRVGIAALTALFVVWSAAFGAAQTYQGSVRGIVRDGQGVVPGAEIVLTSDENGSTRSAVSNEVGEYTFTGVLPGVYTLRTSLAGFRAEERKGLRVATQQTLVQDFLLEVGAIEEQITVTGESPLVERSSATVAASLDKDQLKNLPIFGRNAFYAAISTPGVVQSGDPQFVRYQDQTNASYLSLGGGPRRGNGYLLEGVATTDFINRPTIVPSIEAVEEVRVQTKTYESDMGHASGGVFNTTARSGSNSWHGSVLGLVQARMGNGTAVLREEGGCREPAAVLPQLGRIARRPGPEEPDVFLVQCRQLRTARYEEQRPDAADCGRAER